MVTASTGSPLHMSNALSSLFNGSALSDSTPPELSNKGDEKRKCETARVLIATTRLKLTAAMVKELYKKIVCHSKRLEKQREHFCTQTA